MKIRVINVQTPIKTHLFGFRIDPKEKLHQLERQIFNLWRIYHDKPIFGVELEDEDVRISGFKIFRLSKYKKNLIPQYKIMMNYS